MRAAASTQPFGGYVEKPFGLSQDLFKETGRLGVEYGRTTTVRTFSRARHKDFGSLRIHLDGGRARGGEQITASRARELVFLLCVARHLH